MTEHSLSAQDFTESSYRSLLARAAARFRFGYIEELASSPTGLAVWRHDVDISPQRALAIARIDSEFGLGSYFFVQLSSSFYSPLEPYFPGFLQDLISLGHEVGLHFDPGLASGSQHEESQVERLEWEVAILSKLAGKEIKAFSVHNPTVTPSVLLQRRFVGGLENASWDGWRSLATYCSDSNGYWRFQSANDVIGDQDTRSLYLLTHCEWWLPEASTPYGAVLRATRGRAAATESTYVDMLDRYGRELRGGPSG